MRFDAYAGSIRQVEFQRVIDDLSSHTGYYPCQGPRLKRFGETINLDTNGRTALMLGWDSGNGLVYFEGKGETSPRVAKAIRALYPDSHSVARADVCEDYDEEGVFDVLQSLIRTHKGARTKAGYVALPDDPTEGKTWAVGRRGTVAYMRVYEKGKQPEHVMDCRPNWTRVEGEFRPQYAKEKLAATRMQPLEFFGLAGWTRRVAEALTNCPVQRFEADIQERSHEKTRLYLARTFRRFFEADLADGIDTMRSIRQIWEEDDAAKAAWMEYRQQRGELLQ